MTFKLPELPYAYDALEPVIDEATMKLHHDKHHNAYVTKLNAAVEGTDYADKDIEALIADVNELPEDIRNAVRNNGGGHLNHSIFWELLTSPKENNEIPTELEEKIVADFGSVEEFKEQFETAGKGQFGSGWAWLVDNNGKFEVVATANQDNPITDGKKVLLGVDVWEHAYYLNYQNRRPDYLKEFWRVVNWEKVVERLNK